MFVICPAETMKTRSYFGNGLDKGVNIVHLINTQAVNKLSI